MNNVNYIIKEALIKSKDSIHLQEDLDNFLCSLDGTKNKSKLGANAILAVSSLSIILSANYFVNKNASRNNQFISASLNSLIMLTQRFRYRLLM